MSNPRILIVLTSHDTLGQTGEKTGFWLEEFAAPYYVFRDAGADITLASPLGGHPPIDPKSALEEWQTADTQRFALDPVAQAALAETVRLVDLDAGDFDAIFFPGGHGPMWDFPDDRALADLIEAFDEEQKPIGAVCHGPVALVGATRSDGCPLVAGKRISAFTNTEEQAVGLAEVVPFLLQDRIAALGATFVKSEDFTSHVVTDGHLVTGQNPQSSVAGAEAVLALLKARNAAA